MKLKNVLETHKLPKLTQEGIEKLHRPITSKEIKPVIKKQQQKTRTPSTEKLWTR